MNIADIPEIVRPYTMVPASGVQFTMEQALKMIAADVPGDFVECGVWRGGCALAMLLAQRVMGVPRKVHLLDGFMGLPLARHIDGPAAIAWQAETTAKGYYENCKASRLEVENMLTEFGFAPPDYKIWEGMFHKTLPEVAAEVKSIALLRIDCDWYDSVSQCLEALVGRVSPGGTVILDDYYAWDGCARATHDFLSEHLHSFRIRSLPDYSAAYFIKE